MKLKFLLSVLGSIFLFNACTAQQAPLLNADEFEKGISTAGSRAQILDVRTPGEFNSGHIPDALLANWNDPKEFDRRVAFLDKKKPLYVYCLSGGRSHAAVAKLSAGGFEKVYELKGGINAWKNGNKKTEGLSDAPGMSLDAYRGALQSANIVLVDVWAPWCPPCKVMEPVLASLQKKYADRFLLVKVESGKDEEVTRHLEINELPVFLIYKDGKQTFRHMGVLTEQELEKQLFP